MATRTSGRPKSSAKLEKADLLDLYRVMLLARRIDDKRGQVEIHRRLAALGYELVRRGEIPSLRLGRRIVVPRGGMMAPS